jgi:hypothetical protein
VRRLHLAKGARGTDVNGDPVNLFGINCLSSSECTAIGIQPSRGGANLTLVEAMRNSQPPPGAPEARLAIVLPMLGVGMFGAVFVVQRRERDAMTV